jgi:tRNA(adenine34) deaminase
MIAATNNFTDFDLSCMQRALQLAKDASALGEVPVGAVLVNNHDLQIIGEGFNKPISTNDPTAHAEIIAIRQAAQAINNYRLVNTTLYVTLEPCAMCAGSLLHARINRLIFATPDPKAGAIGGAMHLYSAAAWNHSVSCAHGLLADSCGDILREFFKARRHRN